MKTVGMIGLGIMGGAIARNLIAREWRVLGFDVDPARCAEARDAGVYVQTCIGDAVTGAPFILTSLPNAHAVEAVAKDIASCGVRKIVAELSTLALHDKLAFAGVLTAGGHAPLDCPLSGTGAQALERDLVVYASGDRQPLAALAPLFADFARRTVDLGVFGNGSRMKFIANLLVAVNNVASAEAMVLGMKAGLDPHAMVDIVGAGAAASKIFELRAPMMADNVYEPATMRVSTWQKDMAVIDAFARDLGCETPCFNATQAIYDAAMQRGLGAQDTAAVCRVLEDRAGLSR